MRIWGNIRHWERKTEITLILTTNFLSNNMSYIQMVLWDKVLKNELRKFCARQPLKNLKGYGLLTNAEMHCV